MALAEDAQCMQGGREKEAKCTASANVVLCVSAFIFFLPQKCRRGDRGSIMAA